MIVHHKTLPYDQLHKRYASMQSLQGFVLLRSHPKSAGRFDMLAALPLSSCRQLDCDDWIQQWHQTQQDGPWPFIGGVIGWVSYEACLSWHKLTKAPHTIHQLPPLELHYYPGAIIVDHQQQSVNLVWQDAHKDWANSLASAWNSKVPKLDDFEFSAPFYHCTPKTDYEQALQAISEFIKQGRVYQVNYTQAFTAPFKGDSFNFYQTTESRNPVAYGGFFKGLDYELMSFSPECFIQISNHKAITQPIKGTIGRSDDPIEDKARQDWLLNSEKNRAENIMIVDLLRNDFSQLAIAGSVKVNFHCQLKSYANVHHLVSEVQADVCPDIHPWRFVKACMPGGSITGTPKHEAMKVISELEPYQRGPYCGHLFYLSAHGRFDSNIMIRTAVSQQQHLSIAAGGGIVIDSNPAQEYQECLAKLRTIVPDLIKVTADTL